MARRPRLTIAIGALAALLVAAPLLPRGGGEEGAVRPATDSAIDVQHAVAGASPVDAAAQAEIDRVVGSGLATSRTLTARSTPVAMVGAQVRCADFEGQRYCLHTGWTDQSQEQVQAEANTEVARLQARPATHTNTGDVNLLTELEGNARLSPAARAAKERQELTDAAAAVAKVWLLRHQIQGVPLPDGFLARHPEVTAGVDGTTGSATKSAVSGLQGREPVGISTAGVRDNTSTTTASGTATNTASGSASPTATATNKSWNDYPQGRKILSASRVAAQTRTYYCGPTSMQMIAWNWSGTKRTQEYWAGKLGTTSGGSAITEMVRVTNAYTGWDNNDHAGPYITLDISDWSFSQWWLLQMRHVADYRAPLIFHPILLKRYYPYLDDDASGHFQVGRGYNKNGDRLNLVGYFEPWNQQRFDPSEPYIPRVQWRSAYKSYRANQAHFQHNIGV